MIAHVKGISLKANVIRRETPARESRSRSQATASLATSRESPGSAAYSTRRRMAIVETSHRARDSLSSLTSSAVKKQSQHDHEGVTGKLVITLS